MKIAKLRRYIPIFRVPALRVLLELLIVQTIFTIVYPLIFPYGLGIIGFPKSVPPAGQQVVTMKILSGTYYLFFGVISTLWVVLRWRLRPSQRTRLRQLLYEIGMSLIFGLELILYQIILDLVLIRFSLFDFLGPFSYFAIPRISLMGPFGACVFLLLRAGVYIVLLWNRLRKARIRWALTHA